MFECHNCKFSTEDESRFQKHLQTNRHLKSAKRDENLKSAKYACDTCYKRFHSQKTCNKHKEGCAHKQHPYECQHCKKVFNDSGNKTRHQQSCALKTDNQQNGDQNSHISGSNNTVNQTVNQTVHQTNNYNIVLNEFGQENMDHVTEEEHEKFIKNCIKKNVSGILDYIENRHFDKAHPHNNNIKRDKKTSKFCKVYKQKAWKNELVIDIIKKILKCIYSDYGETIDVLLEQDSRFEQKIKTFMYEVGKSLDFDFGIDHDEEETPKQKERKKKEIYEIVQDFLYIKTKELSQA